MPLGFMCKHVNDVLADHTVFAPARGCLQVNADFEFQMPECSATCAPKRQKKRYRFAGEAPSAATQSPPRPLVRSPVAEKAQHLLRYGLVHSSSYVILLYKNKSGNSSSRFDCGASANQHYHPFRYMAGKVTLDSYGQPHVCLSSMLQQPGPRTLLLAAVQDAVVVTEVMARQCAKDGSWTDPRDNVSHAAIGKSTRPCSMSAQVTVVSTADEYEVDAIVDERRVDSGIDPSRQEFEYLVRWKGFQSDEDQWMPMASLQCCADVYSRWVDNDSRPVIWNHRTDPGRWATVQAGASVAVYDDECELWRAATTTECRRATWRVRYNLRVMKPGEAPRGHVGVVTHKTWLRDLSRPGSPCAD